MESELSLTKALAKIMAGRTPRHVFSTLQLFLTEKELQFVERRLRVGFLLEQGDSYSNIQKKLRVSAATVASVAEQMRQDQAFADLISRIKKEQQRFVWIRNRI